MDTLRKFRRDIVTIGTITPCPHRATRTRLKHHALRPAFYNADAMHSSRRIMQTASSRDNRRASEWEGTRRTKGNKLFRGYARARLKSKFYLPLAEDNGFLRYARNSTSGVTESETGTGDTSSRQVTKPLGTSARNFPAREVQTAGTLGPDRCVKNARISANLKNT